MHSPEVVDDDHDGVRAAADGDPNGWHVTLHHLQNLILAMATDSKSSNDPRATGLMFRGEKKLYPIMRTSLDRWLDSSSSSKRVPWDADNRSILLQYYQTEFLNHVVSRGVEPLIVPTDLTMYMGFGIHYLISLFQNPAVRHMLCQLQHQGVPTNLLDWTHDMYVALHFACEETDCQDGRVWFMSLAPDQQNRLMSMQSRHRLRTLFGVQNEDWHGDEPEPEPYIIVEPNRSDPRLQSQASMFLWLEDGRITWQDPEIVRGVTIPRCHKSQLRHYLKYGHGMEHRTLFADWSGAVSWLRERKPQEFVTRNLSDH